VVLITFVESRTVTETENKQSNACARLRSNYIPKLCRIIQAWVRNSSKCSPFTILFRIQRRHQLCSGP